MHRGIVVSAFFAGVLLVSGAQAAELKVLAGGGITAPLDALKAEFERTSGHTVAIRYGTTPQLIALATSGEPFDMVIVPREVFTDANAVAQFASGEPPEIARVGLGVAVKAGAKKPDIGSAEAIKRLLLEAKSISTLPSSAAGAQIMATFEKLGIAHAVKPKLVIASTPARIAEAVAKDEAEIAVFLTNVLTAAGVDVVGPFPPELQQHVIYWAAPAKNATQPDAARAFLAFVRTPAAAATIKAKGMTPPG